MKRRALWSLLPVTVCLALYWPGLTAWFHQDDFAWLGLGWQVGHGMPLSQALFAPMAQGTVRVLSERLYFVLFYSLFGLHALPYRMVVFATLAASLFLLASLARRLTGSRAAGVCAALLWAVNTALATPLSWSSAYNQVLCAFFVLAGLWLLLKYLDTGRRRYCAAQWLAFLLGFGASEFTIVYPAAAALLVAVLYRRLPRSVLALFLPSAVFAALHVLLLKPLAAGPYVMHWDARIFSTFATYWSWSLGPGQVEWFERMSAPLAAWLTVALTIPVLAFAMLQARRRDFLPLALLAWYALWLAPILTLPNHIIEYYPLIGSIGLAILGSLAALWCWRAGKAWTALAACLLATYAVTSVIPDWLGTRWHHDQGSHAKALLQGVARAQAGHPGKTILLSGVDRELFWAGVFDDPFRLLGGGPVYLTPDTPGYWRTRPELGDLSQKYKPPVQDAVIYDVRANQVSAAQLPVTAAAEVLSVGGESATPHLGEGWHQPEGTHRWMGKRASLTIPRPRAPGAALGIAGYVPAFLVASGPVRLKVAVNDQPVGATELRQADAPFAVEFPLPAALAGDGDMRVTLEVGNVVRPPGDGRDLGLAVTRVTVR
jgi:4-amino-4-deoxy-L-arabinose transferase-like glycosyltransferase